MNTGLATHEAGSTSPYRLMELAVERGADISVIERLAALQCEMLDRQAKIDFNEAMQRAQAKMRRIGTDSANPQTRSTYASYAKLDSVLRPIYSEEGFSLSFNNAPPPSPDTVRILCHVTRGAHERIYQIDMPSDGKGAKGGDVMTKTHAVGSAESYGMRYLLKMIFNVAIGETDDDGNMGISNEERESLFDSIRTAPTIEELKARYRVAARKALDAKDSVAMRILTDWKDERKAELSRENEPS